MFVPSGVRSANATVVRNVHVADFETGALAIQTARAQRRQTPLVREHRQRVGLADDLRQLAAAEEIFDGRGNALGIDQALRAQSSTSFRLDVLLHGAAKLEEALA